MYYRSASCLFLFVLVGSTATAQEGGYSNYREAMAAGAKLYNAGKLAESRAPQRVSITVPPLVDQTPATETHFTIKIKNDNNRAIRIVGLTWC